MDSGSTPSAGRHCGPSDADSGYGGSPAPRTPFIIDQIYISADNFRMQAVPSWPICNVEELAKAVPPDDIPPWYIRELF